jgi:hypothetical protein
MTQSASPWRDLEKEATSTEIEVQWHRWNLSLAVNQKDLNMAHRHAMSLLF